MNKDKLIRTLMLLSTLDGYIIGSIGAHKLPDYLFEELEAVSNMIVEVIKENNESMALSSNTK